MHACRHPTAAGARLPSTSTMRPLLWAHQRPLASPNLAYLPKPRRAHRGPVVAAGGAGRRAGLHRSAAAALARGNRRTRGSRHMRAGALQHMWHVPSHSSRCKEHHGGGVGRALRGRAMPQGVASASTTGAQVYTSIRAHISISRGPPHLLFQLQGQCRHRRAVCRRSHPASSDGAAPPKHAPAQLL